MLEAKVKPDDFTQISRLHVAIDYLRKAAIEIECEDQSAQTSVDEIINKLEDCADLAIRGMDRTLPVGEPL